MTIVVVAAVAVLAGALVRGYTGFGASMFWVASLSLLYAPSSVVPTVLALEILASVVLLPAVWREVQWRSLRWLLGSTVLTMPIGVAMLATVPERPMRVVVALAILAGTAAVASGFQVAGDPGPRTAVTAGSVSGVVNGATAIGGPPAILLYFSSTTAQDVGRATLIAYFLAIDTIGLAMMATVGLVDVPVLTHGALFAPIALGGLVAGQAGYRRWGARNFRGVVLTVLTVLSLVMLVRAAQG